MKKMYEKESVNTKESVKKGSRGQKGPWDCIWDSKTRGKIATAKQLVSSGGCPHFGDTWKPPFGYPTLSVGKTE